MANISASSAGAEKIYDFIIRFNPETNMTLLRLLEIVLIVLLLRALFPVFIRLLRGGLFNGNRPAERYKEEQFDKNKTDIEDGEYKELK
jgi:hypothetical protein